MTCKRKAGAAIFCTCGLAIEMKRARPHIHVPPDHEDMALSAYGVARLHQAVELAPFLKQWGLGRVQIFRLPIAHHPPAEADHRAARAEDREHHAVAETVVALALLAFDHQAGLDERLVLVCRKRGLQALPALGRVADTETSRDFS